MREEKRCPAGSCTRSGEADNEPGATQRERDLLMPETCSFDDLIRLLRSRDKDATAEVFKKYAHRLIGLARTRLDQRLQGKVGPEDVVQSVFRSFFVRVGHSPWQLESEDSLWAILVAMTVRKCGRKANFFLRKKRGGGAPEVAIDAEGVGEPSSGDPSPEEAAKLEETMEELTRQLDDRERVVLEL